MNYSCPLCHASKTHFLFTSHNRHGRHTIDSADTFNIYKCAVCSLRFIAPMRVDSAYYQKYYESDYYETTSNKSIITRLVNRLQSWSLKQKETYILHNAPSRQRLHILDVGCGSGEFLASLDTKRFIQSGIEINPHGARLSRAKGLTIYEKNIMDIDFKEQRFDVITLWHVLEHLHDPIRIFKKIHTILAADGILVFATPTTDSLGYRIGKWRWFHLDSPRHLILFNKKSVHYLCNKTGFTIQRTVNEFYDYPLDLLWSVQGSLWKYSIIPLYPLVKSIDAEALTCIVTKSPLKGQV